MPNYKLGIGTKENARVIELDNPSLKELKNLDTFTMESSNADELKAYLLAKGLIDIKELKKNLWIVYRHVEVKSIKVVYRDMKKYLDPSYLRARLKSLSSDIKFLEKLANYYSVGSYKFNPQAVNVSAIRLYIIDVRSNGGRPFYSKSLDIALDGLIERAITRQDGFSEQNLKENYRGLRDLAILVHDYELNTKKLERKTENEEIQNNYSNIPREYYVDGEPMFPPNSEEEANYFRTLEELGEMDIEDHPHFNR